MTFISKMRIPLSMVIRVRPILSLYRSHVPSQSYLPPPHAVCNYLHVRYKARYISCMFIYKYSFSVYHVFHPASVTLPPSLLTYSKTCKIWSFPPLRRSQDEMIAVLHGYKQLYIPITYV